MNVRRIFIVLSLMCACLCSCIKQRSFNVDEGLLEKRSNNENLRISYCMPAGYKAVRQSMVDSIAMQEQQYNPFDGKICAIYVDTLLNNANVILTDMSMVPAERTENKLDFYFTEFNPNNIWDDVSISRYKFSDFPKVVQLDMYNESKHLTKIFFYSEDKARFCVDYLYPQEFYNDLLPFIEASIGSFENYISFDIQTEDYPISY